MKSKLVVYTTILGDGYELPVVTPEAGVDFVCFTDQPDLSANGWTIRMVRPMFPADLTRSSRLYKILAHRFLHDYDRSIYHDPSVGLLAPAENLWDRLIPETQTLIGIFHHSYRDTLRDEFAAVSRQSLEHQVILREWRLALEQFAPKLLEVRPMWGGDPCAPA